MRTLFWLTCSNNHVYCIVQGDGDRRCTTSGEWEVTEIVATAINGEDMYVLP